MTLSDLPQIGALSPSEKLQLVEDLWDDIASNPANVPVPDWQQEELARRKVAFEANPASGRTWDEVKEHARQARPNVG